MSKQLKADLSLVLVSLFWGISFPLISVSLKQIPPYSFIFLRYGLASIILLLVVFKLNKFKNLNIKSLKTSIYIGASLGFGIIFQTVGLLYTTPSRSGFLTGLNVMLVPIFIAIMYRKMPTKRTILGIIISVAGLFMMSLDFNNLDLTLNKGDIFTLISAVFFAVNILIIDKFISGNDVILVSALQFGIISLMGFFPALFVEKFSFQLNNTIIISIVVSAIFCTIFAFGIQNIAQPYTTPTHVAVIFLLEPVFSAFFSIFVGDLITGTVLFGSALILIGMFIVSVKSEKEKEKNDNESVGFSNE